MKTLVQNRQAGFQYFIESTYLAGLMLEGWEVKAILGGQATFNGGAAYVFLKDGEAWLEGMTITPLKQTSKNLLLDPQPSRQRKLLLNRTELTKLQKQITQKGYTLVPLELQLHRKMKLQIGVGKGKKSPDKRETIKARDVTREIQRELKAAR